LSIPNQRDGSVGTTNNRERTGDRDLEWSRIMGRPSKDAEGCEHLRSCDYDVTLICDKCSLPVFISEVYRGGIFKPTRYVKALAKAIGVPAMLILHQGDQITVTNIFEKVTKTFTENEYVKWVEHRMKRHMKEKHSC
jgi:hypothetical protein